MHLIKSVGAFGSRAAVHFRRPGGAALFPSGEGCKESAAGRHPSN